MPSRIFNTEPAQSGLDAFLSGAGESYTGVRNERRKRQVESQQDALLRQQMEVTDAEQQRKNIEGGLTRVSMEPITQATDQIRAATSQASGVRAKIGAILGRAMGGGASALQPTGTLVKTGESSAERLARMGEEGATARQTASLASHERTSAANLTGEMTRHGEDLDELRRYHDMWAADQREDRGIRASQFNRAQATAESRDLRDYGRQLNEEIASLQRMAADRNGIMQQVGGAGDPVAAYQQKQREIRTRIGELHQQLNDVNATMSRRAIGSKLAAPAPKKAPAGVPARQPTLEEDILAASRPGR